MKFIAKMLTWDYEVELVHIEITDYKNRAVVEMLNEAERVCDKMANGEYMDFLSVSVAE